MVNDAITTQALTKQYRRETALSELDLRVPEGAVYALVGANGAGKSTLIKLLMNIIPATSGEATVLGVRSSLIAGEVFERIGYVSENQKMPEGMTVGEFLGYMRPFYPRWDEALQTQLVRQFDLPLKRKLKNLSRGMKMKAALASVLAYRPSLIVLDEPFSGLDPLVRDEFIASLCERAAGATIFVSTHDLSEIETLATHVGYLERGKLVFSEDMATLMSRFREVAIMLPAPLSDGAAASLIRSLPSEWLQPEVAGSDLRFVHSRFTDSAAELLAESFPDAAHISAIAMTLRSIFVAVARDGRLGASSAERRDA